MFKSIGKAISNAYSSVKNTASNIFGSIGGKTKTANAASPVFGSAAYMRQNSNAGYTYDSIGNKVKVSAGASGSWTPNLSAGQLSPGLNSGIASGSNSSGGVGSASYGPQLPVTISAGRQSTGGTSSPTLNLSGYNPAAFAPTTISAKTLGAQTGSPGGASLQSTGGSIGNPVSLSSAPTSVNPGTINNTGLAGTVAGYKQYNAKTGQFDDIAETPANETVLDASIKRQMDMRKKLYEQYGVIEPGTVNDDPEVRQAQQQRQQIKDNLRGPTAELNAIVAKQNQDLLQLRQTGSQEGVTEAVYGGQQNAINYNAAIRALPLQASIASLQGDLALAQDYLTELKTQKTEQIKKQSEANKRIIDSIEGIMDDEDRKAGDAIKSKNDIETKKALMLEDYKYKVMDNVFQNAPESLRANLATRISNAEDIEGVAKAAGQYATSGDNQIVKLDDGSTVVVDKNTGAVVQNLGGAKGGGPNSGVLATLPTSIQGKVISIANGFGDKPNIKKYIEAIDSNNIVRGIDPKSKNPADHQQIVYAFAKALDPDSAVKEGEYDTIKKYAQSSISKYGKEITNAINGTGFLSEKAIENIQTTINNTLESRKTNYLNSVKETRKIINNIAGTDVADEIMIDYSGGIKNESVTNNTAVDFTATLDNIFK